jgi:hypothetical protein
MLELGLHVDEDLAVAHDVVAVIAEDDPDGSGRSP